MAVIEYWHIANILYYLFLTTFFLTQLLILQFVIVALILILFTINLIRKTICRNCGWREQDIILRNLNAVPHKSNKFVDFVGSGENSDQENSLINSHWFDGRDGLKLPISFPYSLDKSYAKRFGDFPWKLQAVVIFIFKVLLHVCLPFQWVDRCIIMKNIFVILHKCFVLISNII
ncbi:hypothetical protein ACJX0J_009621, partial [Zea mays]